MSTEQRGMRQKIACTGSPHRESVSAVNELSLNSLNRKVMHIKADVDGLRFENKDAEGRLASLALSVDGINSQVQQQTGAANNMQAQITALQQTSKDIQISVQDIRQEGVSKVRTSTDYTFDDKGLKISRSGQQMENLLDNTGMYVRRGGEAILQANAEGVKAVDVKVNNYLIVGDNARFENYGIGRTACFYVGG
jgi:chromosome segregation ATPase